MEKIKNIISEVSLTEPLQDRLLKVLFSIILLLQDRANYIGNKAGDQKIYPLSPFKKFINYLLIHCEPVSASFDKEGKYVLFAPNGIIKRDLDKKGYFFISSPSDSFPVTVEKEKKEKEYEFDVAISFAGENRLVAEILAEKLSKEYYLKVFYDDSLKFKLWGKDLYEFLYETYSERCQLCIILISKDYNEKIWPSHELKGIHHRVLQQKKDYVLPIRLDDSPIPKEFFSLAYLDMPKVDFENVCNEINSRIWSVKKYHWYTEEDVFDCLNAEFVLDFYLNEFYSELRRQMPDDERLIKIILSLVFLFDNHVKDEIKALFNYLVFGFQDISRKFENDIYQVISPNGLFYRSISNNEILVVNSAYWEPLIQAQKKWSKNVKNRSSRKQ